MSFCVWLTYCTTKSSGPVPVEVCEGRSWVRGPHFLCHPSAAGRWGCLHSWPLWIQGCADTCRSPCPCALEGTAAPSAVCSGRCCPPTPAAPAVCCAPAPASAPEGSARVSPLRGPLDTRAEPVSVALSSSAPSLHCALVGLHCSAAGLPVALLGPQTHKHVPTGFMKRGSDSVGRFNPCAPSSVPSF